ncbi:hypothetical protein LSTR_LSTR007809 [Laodelphax striatellus]|uniref:C3H1-type domain-containing protein n=1 Tax=Laodelphax striatellus TaxID=195883 RepID=A0A482WMK9_LAOST|nr:hypothetical protein LSTR_LSTR007809 [Laodelphax striatellus]
MLPSKGFFASYLCPFFEQGSCERPYCHFHHRKKTNTSEIKRGSKANHSIQANHTKESDELKEIENYLDITPGKPEYRSTINETSNSVSYTPTPIAILKKRNTTGCNNNKLEIDEEILIKKQKTQTCNGLESSENPKYDTQNFVKTEEKEMSLNAIECQPVYHNDGELNACSNYIEMKPNNTHNAMLDSSYAEEISFNNENSCDQLKNNYQSLRKTISKNSLNHSILHSNQTDLYLAGGEFKTETNTSIINCQSTKTNISYSDASNSTFSLGPYGESLMNNILTCEKNKKYFDHIVDENDTKENSYNAMKDEDLTLKRIINLDENGCTTTNEDILNNSECTPKETYANIVKQDKYSSYYNKNKSQYSLETFSKVGHNRILTEGNANIISKTNGASNIASRNFGNYAKSNKIRLNEENTHTQDHLSSSCTYRAPSNSLLNEKSKKETVLNEKVSGLGTYEMQSSIIQNINVKQRISHSDPTEKKKGAIENAKVKSHCSPSQVLLERWKTASLMNKKNIDKNKETAPKMRIAYVPNVTALLAERERITNSLTKSSQVKDNSSNSLNKFEGLSLLKNDLLVEFVDNSKIPIIRRQTFLNKVLEIYSNLYNYETARSKAVDTEKEICSTSKTQTTYYNKFAQLFMRLKKETATKNESQETTTENTQETKEADRLLMYNDLLKYIMSDLEDNGIPVPHPEKPGYAKMKKIYGVSSYNKNKSICINCLKEFEVDSAGYSIERNNCKFHSGKKYRQKRKYGVEKVWTCCNGDEERDGCMENELHVRDMVDYDNIPGFKQIREPTVSSEEACQVYALDCEMCYTTEGSELTRCTVVDSNLNVVYDKLCAPDLPIVDYCTKFSGISEGDLDNVSTKLTDIQDDLLNLFTTETILIGHGIGNDLKAVKLFHRSIIDTNVVYGNFRKHKLSDLTKEILHREIQISEGGHDSCEDAIATMELMLIKVKEDRKKVLKLKTGTGFNVKLNEQKLMNNSEKLQKKMRGK